MASPLLVRETLESTGQVLPAQCSPASHELLAVAQIQLQRFLLSGGTCGKHALDLLTHHPIFAFGACIHSRHVRLRRLSECSMWRIRVALVCTTHAFVCDYCSSM